MGFALGWWITLFVLWLALVGQPDAAELVAGVLAASIGTFAAVRVTPVPLRLRGAQWRWLAALPRLLLALVRDSWRLFATLPRLLRGRDHPGAFRQLTVPRTWPLDARRALWTLQVSFPPNTYVVFIDPDTRTAIVHELLPRGGAR